MPLVTEYNPEWPSWFEQLKEQLEGGLAGVPNTIEHVGSTSISGMDGKPIIDLDIVIEPDGFPQAKQRLSNLGYYHQGDLGCP